MRRTLPALVLLAGAPALGAGPGVDCLLDGIVSPPAAWPDYGPAGAELAPHCYGTSHQTITAPERVVFLGDSITVGTPPTSTDDLYRNRLVDALVAQFGLTPPSALWRTVDPLNGTTAIPESGDFASCASWGARADDLLLGDEQLLECFPAPSLAERTLVVMTIGGNDIVALAEDAADGQTPAQLAATRDAFVQQIDDALAWLRAPGRFPNGVWIALANIYDPTDGTGAWTGACALVGPDPLGPIGDLMIETQELLLERAVAREVDLVFARERFCGHGLQAENSAAPCYRGPGTEVWIDDTCIHPGPEGHAALADDFFDTITSPPLPVPALPRWALAALLIALAAIAVRGRRAAAAGGSEARGRGR